MTSSEPIPPALLKRKAVVYVRQSSQSQVLTNLESKRRQYDLVELARQRGFVDVEVIDDDLGRSASGTVARPGFGVLPSAATADHSFLDARSGAMRVTSEKSRVRESRPPGSVRAEPNGRATRPAP